MRKTPLVVATLTTVLLGAAGCTSSISVSNPRELFQMPEAPAISLDMGAPGGATLAFDIGPATGFTTKAGFPAQTWAQVSSIDVCLVHNDSSDSTNNPEGKPNFAPLAPGGIPAALANDYSTTPAVSGSTFSITGPQLATFTGSTPTRTNNTMQFTNVPISNTYRLMVKIRNSVPTDIVKVNPQLGPVGPTSKFALSTNYASIDALGNTTYAPTGLKLNVDAQLDDGSASDPIQADVTVTDGTMPGTITFNP
jgi:hypothetical protein